MTTTLESRSKSQRKTVAAGGHDAKTPGRLKTSPQYIKWFSEISIEDIPLVGGKNASLGEMYRELTPKGVTY